MKEKKSLENYMFLKSVLEMDAAFKKMNYEMLKKFIYCCIFTILFALSVLIPPLAVVAIIFSYVAIINPKLKNDDFREVNFALDNLSKKSKFESLRKDKVKNSSKNHDKYTEALQKQQLKKQLWVLKKGKKPLTESCDEINQSVLKEEQRKETPIKKPNIELSNPVKTQEEKYYEALELQRSKKETSLDKIYETINLWADVYDLPAFNIDPKDYDYFWKEILSFLQSNKVENEYEVMEFISGLLLQEFCENGKNEITTIDLVNSVDFLISYNNFTRKKFLKKKMFYL